MSAMIERRVAALEVQRHQAQRWVWQHEGETTAQAKLRAGLSPDDVVTVFSWSSSKPTEGAAT